MNSENLWQVFLETGAPEVYLLYNSAKKLEEQNVLNDSGPCAPCNQLQ